MPQPLVVGSWPGPGIEYVTLFCKGLESAGIIVQAIDKPWRKASFKLDVLHIHWPEQVFWNYRPFRGALRAIWTVIILVLLKISGVKLVWCVHNLVPHDSRPLRLAFWKEYARAISWLVDGFVTLSPSTVGIARETFCGLRTKPGTHIWHPPYAVPSSSSSSLSWRTQHAISESNVLFAFIGQVRRYKGIEELLDAFAQVQDPNFRLVIAGVVYDSNLRYSIKEVATKDNRIVLDLRWLSDSNLFDITKAADAVILPFQHILHSGSMIYGLSCEKPVITPETPYAIDLKQRIGPQWIQTYRPPLEGAILSRFRKPLGSPNLTFLSLLESSIKLRTFYEKLFSGATVSAGQ